MSKWPFIVLLVLSFATKAQFTEITTDDSGKLIIKWGAAERLYNGELFPDDSQLKKITYRLVNDVTSLSVTTRNKVIADTAITGIFFDNIPQSKHGVVIWRYKPWNSWTKPIALRLASEMPPDDVQLYYWQYNDSVYGACVPLSGNGFRTTLGNNSGKWGSKAISYAINKNIDTVPAMAVAFSKDPYELFERIYRTALLSMGRGENLRVLKKFPEPFNYIGWCTWNASNLGENLNEELLVNAAKSFRDNKFPLGWILVDDGWFQHKAQQLQSFKANPQKFPAGFAPVVRRLKSDYGIKYMGVWHAFNGLWNGIDPASSLGKHFGAALFSWTQKERPDTGSSLKTYHFIKPTSDSLLSFYNQWHRYLKQQGFDFVKVDNQLVVEKMALKNYPIFTLSDLMHKALYRSVNKHFDSAIINCMDMTPDAYFNFGSSAVARSEEDYFPYEPGETYNLQRGNAAAHVLQAVYNSIYFGQMVYPDFDIFQSHNPNANFHAIARAINCGPIYITDNVGEQKFDVLWPLIYADGKIIRSETPLLPAKDCLFQVQAPRLFKAFSTVGITGLLGVWNAADADKVEGAIKPTDVHNIKGNEFAVYEYFSKELKVMNRKDSIQLKLGRMGYQLYYIAPLKNEFAALGLANKYNAPATIDRLQWEQNCITISLHQGGEFTAYCAKTPAKILVNGKAVINYRLENNKLTVTVPMTSKPLVYICWK